MTQTLVVTSDHHIASTVGLIHPGAELDDGGTYKMSRGQGFLWASWQDSLEQIDKLKQGDLTVVFNGDIIEGDDKGRSNQVISKNKADTTRWAGEILDPLVKMATTAKFIRGTEAHTGKSQELEKQIADDFSAELLPAWQVVIDGVRLDIAHHPPFSGGGKPATRQNKINGLAADSLLTYARMEVQPPHLVIRSHVHLWMDSYDAQPVRAITTAAWTLKTHYIERLEPVALAHIGALMVICDRGQYEVRKLDYKPKGFKWTILK